MNRRLFVLSALGIAIWLLSSQEADAWGLRHKPASCCPTTPDCAPGCSPSGAVSYVEKKVTSYKPETTTKDVKVMVTEWVESKEEYKYVECVPTTVKQKAMVANWVESKEDYKYIECVPTAVKQKTMVSNWVESKEDYKYIECVPVTKTQKVTVPTQQTKQESYTYTEMTTVPTKEKVKTCQMVPVTKDVEVTVYDIVPTVTKQKRIVCEKVCVPVTVTCTVPVAPPTHAGGFFGRLCSKKSCDTGCAPPCPPEPCYQTITKTVMQKQVVSHEIEVNVTTCTRVPRKVMQKVTTLQPTWTEQEVVVNKCVPVQKTGTRTVCFYVPVEKEVPVTIMQPVEKTGTRIVKKCVPVEKEISVTVMQPVEKTGIRTVKKPVQVEKVVKQSFTTMVPYETTVKVPVYTAAPAPAPCATPSTPCATPCTVSSGYSMGGGVFRGGCCHGSR